MKYTTKLYKYYYKESQAEIRLSNIDQAKEFLKKNLNCKSQIRSINQFLFIYLRVSKQNYITY